MNRLIGISLLLVAACGGAQTPAETGEGKSNTAKSNMGESMAKSNDTAATGATATTATGTAGDTTAEAKPEPVPLTIDQKLAVHDACFQKFVSEAPSFFDDCYTASSSEELVDSGMPMSQGIEGEKASTTPFWTGLSLKGETLMNLASGDNVVTLSAMYGTQDGEFMGAKASNKAFGIIFAEVQNLDAQGKHGQVKVYVNLADMLGQLGLAKMPARKPVTASGAKELNVIAQDNDAERANVAAVQAGFDAFNKHDVKALGAAFAKDAVWHNLANPTDLKGKQIASHMTSFTAAFPKGAESVDTIWGAGDYVVAQTTFAGENDGAWKDMGVKKATKKMVTVHELHLFRLEAGKVKEMWTILNGAAVAGQLGMMPAAAATK